MATPTGTWFYTALNGVEVGRDAQGNRYYRERHEPDGRRRWVIYNGTREASRVPPEWRGWLHYTVDETPEEAPQERKPRQAEHRPNMTGTPEAWHPPGSEYEGGQLATPSGRSHRQIWPGPARGADRLAIRPGRRAKGVKNRMTNRSAGCIALILLLGLPAPARADYKAGQAAWDAGRHGEAVTQWRAAARAKDVRAMLALGRAFAKGLGVPQDYIEAHTWLNLAAGQGSAKAAAERDALAAKMTVEEQAEARKLARAWRQVASRAASQAASRAAPGNKAEQRRKPAVAAGPPPKRALREAQTLLARLGYTPGPADGVWRPDSAQAYRRFLAAAGMTAGDTLTLAGLRALRGAAAKDAKGRAGTARPARTAARGLHRAVRDGDIDGLKAALKAGTDANARDRRGWTALMYAADKGHTLMVAPLLAAKADPDVRAADGATALFMAAAHGHAEIVSLLVMAGADISIRGSGGPDGGRCRPAPVRQPGGGAEEGRGYRRPGAAERQEICRSGGVAGSDGSCAGADAAGTEGDSVRPAGGGLQARNGGRPVRTGNPRGAPRVAEAEGQGGDRLADAGGREDIGGGGREKETGRSAARRSRAAEN